MHVVSLVCVHNRLNLVSSISNDASERHQFGNVAYLEAGSTISSKQCDDVLGTWSGIGSEKCAAVMLGTSRHLHCEQLRFPCNIYIYIIYSRAVSLHDHA